MTRIEATPARLWRLVGAVHRRVAVLRTVHVLPWAGTGAALALRDWPSWQPVALLVTCAVFGRATVVGFLRFFEAPPDVVAPSPSPDLPPSEPPPKPIWLVFAGHGALVTVFLAYQVNPVSGHLSIPFVVMLGAYAAMRRHTGLSHFFLGAGLGVSPAAAWIALGGDTSAALPGIALLGVGISLWAAGFDMIHSLQPALREGVGAERFARPMRFSVPTVFNLARACQALALFFFASPWLCFALDPIFLLGPVLVAIVLLLAHRRVRPADLSEAGTSWLTLNLLTGPIIFASTVLGISLL